MKNQFAEEFIKLAEDRFEKGDYEGAISNLNKAIEINPEDANAYLNRAFSKNNIGDYEEAITDFNKVIEINPEDGNAYNNRGYTKTQLKDFQGAIVDFNKGLEINPKDANAYNSRGFAKTQLKDIQGAIADFKKALAINPNFTDASNNLRFAIKFANECWSNSIEKTSINQNSIKKNTANNSLIKYKYRVDEKGKQYSAIDLKSTIDKFFVGKIYEYFSYFLLALITIKIVSLIGEPFYYFLTNNVDWIGYKVKPIIILCVSACLSLPIVFFIYILVYLIIVFLLDPIVTTLSTKED